MLITPSYFCLAYVPSLIIFAFCQLQIIADFLTEASFGRSYNIPALPSTLTTSLTVFCCPALDVAFLQLNNRCCQDCLHLGFVHWLLHRKNRLLR